MNFFIYTILDLIFEILILLTGFNRKLIRLKWRIRGYWLFSKELSFEAYVTLCVDPPPKYAQMYGGSSELLGIMYALMKNRFILDLKDPLPFAHEQPIHLIEKQLGNGEMPIVCLRSDDDHFEFMAIPDRESYELLLHSLICDLSENADWDHEMICLIDDRKLSPSHTMVWFQHLMGDFDKDVAREIEDYIPRDDLFTRSFIKDMMRIQPQISKLTNKGL